MDIKLSVQTKLLEISQCFSPITLASIINTPGKGKNMQTECAIPHAQNAPTTPVHNYCLVNFRAILIQPAA